MRFLFGPLAVDVERTPLWEAPGEGRYRAVIFGPRGEEIGLRQVAAPAGAPAEAAARAVALLAVALKDPEAYMSERMRDGWARFHAERELDAARRFDQEEVMAAERTTGVPGMEPVWIPGARFEASVAGDRESAEILDRENRVRLRALDAAALGELREAAASAGRLMDAPEAGRAGAETRRFVVSVSADRRLADVVDQESERSFTGLRRVDTAELGELSDALLEIVGAGGG